MFKKIILLYLLLGILFIAFLPTIIEVVFSIFGAITPAMFSLMDSIGEKVFPIMDSALSKVSGH